MSLSVLAEARGDILAAACWYESRELGLGEALVEEIDATLLRIEAGPERFPVMYRSARRALVRRFPYAIYFLCDSADIVILAVLHQRRDRGAINERFEE
ncbi:MAG: type II toxin-antitoxin system RelE/ParE family toxin [Pseudomonadota bacterium]